ncbi:hypothetical protein SAMN05444678_1246 [Sphingomonas sp. YR710]|uniref:hypothetical protein n=1 Tax=Sphingomonas sp. YR710 TaxID=1882773 RepID=UPI00088BD92E|nr:hypothetical protein [Sphingomonas sp. YR710]SDD81767.1 hypothetical protein SAMN05444678_1246 [Sphingomonas sp. YR710]
MTQGLAVAAHPLMRDLTGGLVASLAQSLWLADDYAKADLLVLPGRSGWCGLATEAIESGIRRIMVIDPGPENITPIGDLALRVRSHDAMLVLSESFADNPGVAPFHAALDGPMTFLSLTAYAACSVEDRAARFEQLRLARALGISEIAFTDAQTGRGSTMALGTGLRARKDVMLRMTALATSGLSARHCVSAFADDILASLIIYPADCARPSEGSVTTPAHRLHLPTIFETPHRATLRRLLAGKEASRSLADFEADVRLLDALEGRLFDRMEKAW